MVGDRPVDLVSFHQKYHYVPNCTEQGLQPLFCTSSNATLICDEYFMRMSKIISWKRKDAIREEVL